MHRKLALFVFLAVAAAVLAQSGKTTPAARKGDDKKTAEKKPAGPAKVSGNPVTTATGLKYWDLKIGTGKPAGAGKDVSVHYTGWLTSGKEFDSSLGSEPIVFALGTGQVIKGWDQGIVGMKVGGKRQLRIPPELGYGQRGAPPSIPPNATLVFDVELVAMK